MSLLLSAPSRPRRYPVRPGLLSLVWLLGLLLGAGRIAHAEFKLTIDQKDGDKIADVAKIVAHADSSDGIDKVEFYVDDQLRVTAGSVPYVFKWDTIPDMEGKHTLAITAYDSNGQTKKISVSLVIDNELALGGPALAKKALDALAANNTDVALNYSRRALKAEPGNVDACRVIAALAARDSDWDKAAATLEKASGYDQNPDALKELATYKLRRALLPDNVPIFVTEVQKVAELRQKGYDLAVAKMKTKDASAHEAIGDALMQGGHLHEAELEYLKVGDNRPLSTTNRLGLVYSLEDEPTQAISILRTVTDDKGGDAATRALMGLALLHQQKFAAARAAVQADLSTDFPAAQIIAAYADVAMGQPARALAEAQKAAERTPNAGDVHYALSMTLHNLADSETELTQAFTVSPFEAGPYLDYAARLALEKHGDRLDDAVKLTDYVIEQHPNDLEAKLVKVMLLLQQNHAAEAEPIIDYQYRHTNAPDVLMAYAVFLNQQNKVGLAQLNWERVRTQDTTHFEFLVIPTPAAFLMSNERKYHYRGDFFLTLASLYPPKAAPKVETPAQDSQ